MNNGLRHWVAGLALGLSMLAAAIAQAGGVPEPIFPIDPNAVQTWPRPTAQNPTDFEAALLTLVDGLVPRAGVARITELNLSHLLPSSSVEWGLHSHFGEDEEAIEIDGETLRFYLEPLRGWLPGNFQQLVDNIRGGILRRGSDHLRVAIQSEEMLTLPIKSEQQARNMELYQVDIPQVLEFNLSLAGGMLRIWGLDELFREKKALQFRVKIPVVSDIVYLRDFKLDLMDGRFEIEAGVAGNQVAIVGRGELTARRFDGIDFWETVRRNRRLISLLLPIPFQYL